jgi:hypothetical protein
VNGVERPMQGRKKRGRSVDTSGIEPDTFRRAPESEESWDALRHLAREYTSRLVSSAKPQASVVT